MEKKKRGLACMSVKKRKAIASKGGSAPHPNGRGMQLVSKAKRREIASLGGKAASKK